MAESEEWHVYGGGFMDKPVLGGLCHNLEVNQNKHQDRETTDSRNETKEAACFLHVEQHTTRRYENRKGEDLIGFHLVRHQHDENGHPNLR